MRDTQHFYEFIAQMEEKFFEKDCIYDGAVAFRLIREA
jgi:hypothetical protein